MLASGWTLHVALTSYHSLSLKYIFLGQALQVLSFLNPTQVFSYLWIRFHLTYSPLFSKFNFYLSRRSISRKWNLEREAKDAQEMCSGLTVSPEHALRAPPWALCFTCIIYALTNLRVKRDPLLQQTQRPRLMLGKNLRFWRHS